MADKQALLIQEACRIDYTPGAAKIGGDVVVLDQLVGVCPYDIEASVLGTLLVSGVFDVQKVTGAIAAGALVYWDADANPVGRTEQAGLGAATTTSSNNSLIGKAIAAAAETVETVRVLWTVPVAVTNTVHMALTQAITDPGNAGAIPVTDTGTCAITTGVSAETRTLAAPTYVGQMLQLYHYATGGGSGITTITVTGATVNETGNNRIILTHAGEQILLVAAGVGATKQWRVVVNNGATLATV